MFYGHTPNEHTPMHINLSPEMEKYLQSKVNTGSQQRI
jgi:hypothetical protein